MENKPKIDENICPHCNTIGGREIHGGFLLFDSSSIYGPITICKKCKKQIKDFWWCDKCMEMIEPEYVTFDERHDERCGGCGMKVT